MTEKEKMINGEVYYANCEELLKERENAKDLCYEYNNLKCVDWRKCCCTSGSNYWR